METSHFFFSFCANCMKMKRESPYRFVIVRSQKLLTILGPDFQI